MLGMYSRWLWGYLSTTWMVGSLSKNGFDYFKSLTSWMSCTQAYMTCRFASIMKSNLFVWVMRYGVGSNDNSMIINELYEWSWWFQRWVPKEWNQMFLNHKLKQQNSWWIEKWMQWFKFYKWTGRF